MPPKKTLEHTPINEASLKKLKVTELKEKLAEHDLDTKGVKDELVKRLMEHFKADSGDKKTNVTSGVSKENNTTAGNDHVEVNTSATPSSEVQLAHLSEADKAKLRAERFGLSTAQKGKQSGGQQHIAGLGHLDPQEEYERRKKRAERFGLPIPTNDTEEKEKKKARAQRFGLPVEMTPEELEAKKKERQMRFMSGEEKKKLERAQRFGS